MLEQKFGRLTVVRISQDEKPPGKLVAECVCDCGGKKISPLSLLIYGKVKSCGCLRLEHCSRLGKSWKTHGQSPVSGKTKTYRSWQYMKNRCLKKTDMSYAYYGGRGIKVCERWMKFENFLEDMGKRPDGMTLDRMDSNGDYSKENCRWVDWKSQQRNKRSNRMVSFNGEIIPMIELSERTGVPYELLRSRISKRGWDVNKAVSTPPDLRFSPRKRETPLQISQSGV